MFVSGITSIQIRSLVVLAFSLLFMSISGISAHAIAADNLVTASLLELTAHESAEQQAPSTLSQKLGVPFVVYIWGEDCGHCAQDLQALNKLHLQQQLKSFSVLIPRENGQVTRPSLRDIPQELTGTTHFYSPYLKAEALQATSLPEVRVYNSAGSVAARYPHFNSQWPEIITLVQQLQTDNFAQYSMTKPNETPSQASDQSSGNLLNLQSIQEDSIPSTKSTLPATLAQPYVSATQSGAQNRADAPSLEHSLSLSKPMAAMAYAMSSGLEVGPDWQGISADFVQAISLDQRLLISADWWNAGDFNDQSIAPNTATPKEQAFSIGYESFYDEIRYSLALFRRSLSFRDDTGVHFDASHQLWNSRTQISLGTSIFDASHEEAVTVAEMDDDINRLSRISLSHRLNQNNRLSFAWFHDALQGIIENPDELVEFGNPAATGSQYALYPTTRTQNNYVLQWHTAKNDYGYSFYKDTWGVEQHQLFAAERMQYQQWHLQGKVALTHQVAAKFYKDLFPSQDAQSLLSRSPQLAGYDSLSLEFQADRDISEHLSLWGKKTFVAIGAGLEYYDFEDLSDTTSLTRTPVTPMVFTTTIGLRVAL